MSRWPFLLLPLAVAGCSSDDDGGSSKPKPEPTLAFEADPKPPGVALTLRQKELTQDRLVLELVGSAVQDLYGVAFRLSYDSAALSFTKLDAGPAWGGAPVIALGAAKTPGLLLGAVTAKGTQSGVDGNEVVLGVVTFALNQQKPSAIDFVAARSAFVGVTGKPVTGVAFAGGDLVLR
ncbi:MAG: hypothetical protein IT377_25950 [Polyangiaceae bacterium]|nr:hypothetical protein [Polyangiaceae bacterium]